MKSYDQLIAASGRVAADDEAEAKAGIAAAFAELDRLSDEASVNAALNAVAAAYAQNDRIQKFVEVCRQEYARRYERAYQKIINPKSGTPCCPECGSPNIAEVGGAYEFTEMKCFACGNTELCDPYQVGDWYK